MRTKLKPLLDVWNSLKIIYYFVMAVLVIYMVGFVVINNWKNHNQLDNKPSYQGLNEFDIPECSPYDYFAGGGC